MYDFKVSISISKRLYEKVMSRVKESRGVFNSVEEYIESVLNKVVAEEQETTTYGPDYEEKMKDRLRRLGYL